MKYIVTPKLGKILTERNMTQNHLAQLTGIPQGTISKFDKNKQHQDTHLIAISRALNLSIEDLFDIEEQLQLQDIFVNSNRELNNTEQLPRDEPYRININMPDDSNKQ